MLGVCIFCRLWRGRHVQRHDHLGIHQHLVGSQPESVHVLVLHYQLLPLPDGDLPANRDRDGIVGDIYVRDSDPGRIQRAGPGVGPTAGDAVEAWEWGLAGFTIFAAVWSLDVSRWVFRRALLSYRSASS